MFRGLGLLLVVLALLLGAVVVHGEEHSAFTQVQSSAPGGLFLVGEELDFVSQVASPYIVRDIYGVERHRGTATVGKFRLPKLPCGAYFLSFPGGEALTFAVLPPPVMQSGATATVALDTGLDATSYCQAKGKWAISSQLLRDICVRVGVNTIRGRTGWREDKKGEYTYQPQLECGREALSQGLELAGMADMPGGAWTQQGCTWRSPMGENQRRRYRGLPDNLLDTYQYFRAFAQEANEGYSYMEFQNEPDLDGYPPWEVAAQCKAATLGMRAGNPTLRVLSPSFCQIDQVYMKHFFHDTASSYFDIFNYHLYYHIGTVPNVCRSYEQALVEAGLGDVPRFITEFGSGYEDFCKPGGKSPIRKNTITPSLEQELVVGEAISKYYLKFIQLGIDKAFLFYLPPYSERGGLKEWGQVRYNQTARPSLIAIATLNHALANSAYVGEYTPEADVQGLLFRHDNGQETLAFWKNSVIDRENRVRAYQLKPAGSIRLKCAKGEYRLRDNYGFERTLRNTTGELEVPLAETVAYLTGPGKFPVTKTTPPRPARYFDCAVREEPTTVVRLFTNKGAVVDSGRKFARVEDETVQLTMELYNFSEREVTGTVMNSTPLVLLEGMPEKVTLAPMSRQVFSLKARFAPKAPVRTTLVVDGLFDEVKIAPASICFLLANRPDAWEEVPLAGAMNPKAWRHNTSGRLKITSEEPGAVQFFSDYTGTTSRWSYPEYLLKDGESMDNVIGIAFDLKLGDVEKTSTTFRYYLVSSTIHEKGDAQTGVFHVTRKEGWYRVHVFFGYGNDFMANVRQLRLGNAARSINESYQIRNFALIRPKK